MVATNTADAIDREVAWLTTTGDGLPSLLAANQGPWDSISRYPRTPYTTDRTIYVTRHAIEQYRIGGQRVRHAYPMRLILWWPLLRLDGDAGAEAQAFDSAVDVLLQRVLGFLGDKTHGGRFLSVGEEGQPKTLHVDFTDVEQTLLMVPAGLRAEITYTADDLEIIA